MKDNIFKLVTPFTKSEQAEGEEPGNYIEGYLSTSVKDRQGHVVPVAEWKKAFKEWFDNPETANPIVCYMHDIFRPIGKVVSYSIKDKGPWIKAEIVDDAIWKLIEKGILKAFSWQGRAKAKYTDVDQSFTLYDIQLLEASVVTIPANPQALFGVAKSLDIQNAETLDSTPYNVIEGGYLFLKSLEPETDNEPQAKADDSTDNEDSEVTKTMTPDEIKELVKAAVSEAVQGVAASFGEQIKSALVDVQPKPAERKGIQGQQVDELAFLKKSVNDMTAEEKNAVAQLTVAWLKGA